MKSEIVAQLAQHYNISPSDLINLNYFVDQVEDEDLLAYISNLCINSKIDLSKPHEFRAQMDSLFLVNAFLRELKKRGRKEEDKKAENKKAEDKKTDYTTQEDDNKNIGEVRSMLLEGVNLDDIVTHCSVILSDSLSKKQYKALVKNAKKHIIGELRTRHKDIVESRLKPFKVFTSLQYYSRIALMTVLIGFTAGITHYLNYKEDNYLVEYAKLMQMHREFKSVEDDLRNPELEKRFEKIKKTTIQQTQKFDFEYECLEQRFAEINDFPIIGGEKDIQVIIPALLEAKIQEYRKFIDETKPEITKKPALFSLSLQAKLRLSYQLKMLQEFKGLNDEWIRLRLEVFEEATTLPSFVDSFLLFDTHSLQGLFEKLAAKSSTYFKESTNSSTSFTPLSDFVDNLSLMEICTSLYTYSLDRYGKKEQAKETTLKWLEAVAVLEQPELALRAHRLLANFYTGFRIKDQEILKVDDNKAKEHLRYVFEHTADAREYAAALSTFKDLDVKDLKLEENGCHYFSHSFDTFGLLRVYKDIAQFTAYDEYTKYSTLLKIGKIYLHLKDYTRANAYFEYIQDKIKDDENYPNMKKLYTEAGDLIVNIEWKNFKEAMF